MEKIEGKAATEATEEEVFRGGGGFGVSKRPKIDGEAVVGINRSKAEGGVVAGAVRIKRRKAAVGIKRPKAEGEVVARSVSTKRPKAEGEVVAGAESSSLEDILSKRPRTAALLRWLTRPGVRVFRDLDSLRVCEGDGVALKAGQELTKTEIEEMIRRDATGPLKRKVLSRMDKRAIEIHMSVPPPTPYPRMPDELIDMLERPECPGQIRAEQDELAAFAQKLIDRDAEIRRQYALQGYAEIELTDDEEEDLTGELRSWAELKEL